MFNSCHSEMKCQRFGMVGGGFGLVPFQIKQKAQFEYIHM